jgi:3-hydroxyacyl-[acyl-carrier-protein] dehydratase
MDEITTLVPHRAPFLYVDELLSVSKEEIIGIKTFKESEGMFRGSTPIVPGVILIEALAQCGEAGVKKLGITDGIFGLTNIENGSFLKAVNFGDTVKMVIKNIRIGGKIIKQSGIAYVDEIAVAEASWMCLRIK